MKPWWLRTGARLAVLLLILGGVGGYALTAGGGGERANLAGWCARPSGAPSLVLPSRSLRALVRAGGLASLARAGRGEEQGVDGPSAAWTDRPPGETSFAVVGPGYEIRWRSRGGQSRMADLFAFATTADAAYYAAHAGSTGCRQAASSRSLSSPGAARSVTWINPHGAWQSDVFFARGRVAYRVSVIGPPAASGGGLLARPAGLSAQPLACQLPSAGCPQSAAVSQASVASTPVG
jgi:hypothetical protein